MAKLFLESTDTTYKVSTSNTKVYGSTGNQVVTVDAATTGVTFDANVDGVSFSGATSDFTYKQIGVTDLGVYKAGTLVATVAVQDDADGSLLTFSNGTVATKFATAGGVTGLTFGGTTVSNSSAATVTPSVIDSATGNGSTSTGVAGQTFTLTTSSDNFTGGTGNDTFNGAVSATAADNTLTLTDLMQGGTGSDTLNVLAAVLAADISVPTGGVQGIETVNIRALDNDGTVGTDAATFVTPTGVTVVNADRNSSNVTVTALATGASVGLVGDGVVANGILKYAYSTATADQIINISGGTSNAGVADITATASTGVTKVTINSTGAANKVDTIKLDSAGGNTVTSFTVNADTNLTATLTANDFAATAALVVSGAATLVDLGTTFDGKTIDASGLTAGGLTIATNTNLTSFKGGVGNDTVSTTAIASTTAGAVDAGAGTGDILNVATGTDADTAAETALYTNFDVLRNSGATDLDVSLFSSISSVQVNSANAGATNMTAAQAANIGVRVTNATNTFSLATATGTSDVLGLTLANSTVTTAVDFTAATITGFETLNVVSSSGSKAGGSGTGNDLSFAAASNLKTINVSGAYDLTIDATNVTSVATVTSTQTGTAALYVSGDFAVGSSVTSSAGADAFILGAVGTTYNSGAGDDTFSATQAQLNTGATYSPVNGGDGTDTLNITGGGAITIVDNVLSKITSIESIVIATTTTNNQSIVTGGFVDSAFKAAGFKLTTTSTTGTVTIDMTSFTGAATLDVTTVGTTGTEGAIDVQTGSGADTVTVSAAAAGGAGVVKTYAGNDKITTVSTEAFAISGGAGNDTIVLGSSGVNTLVFEATAALNGADTITGFDKTADIINWVQGGAETTVTGNLTATADVFYELGGLSTGKADTAAAVATAITSAATWTSAAATAWIAISDDNSTAIYAWTDVAGTAGVQEAELTLVGTVDQAMSTAELATAITIV